MSFGTFSFFYYFVFAWGSLGVLFIAAAVIKEMFSLNKRVKNNGEKLVEKKEAL